jgi:rSAM/selenodomain-associated transferase 2
MPRLSFVIPVLNEASGLGALLAALERDFPAAERVVVDGGSNDDSAAIALRGAHAVLLGEPGRANQMNLGAAVARGDTLCFLHADTTPEFDEAALHAALDGEFAWGFCRVALRSRLPALRMVSAFMNRRATLTGIATGDQMLMVDRELFAEQGGFAAVPLMEDVEICKRLRRVVRPRALPLVVCSSGRRWEDNGVIATILLMWALRLAFWFGVSPERLWRLYYGRRSDLPAEG